MRRAFAMKKFSGTKEHLANERDRNRGSKLEAFVLVFFFLFIYMYIFIIAFVVASSRASDFRFVPNVKIIIYMVARL